MKTRGLTAAILITTAQFAFAQGGGGVSIDNFDSTLTTESNSRQTKHSIKVTPQAPTHKFEVRVPSQNRDFLNTEKLKQSYDGVAQSSISSMNLVAGKPNFIRNLRRKHYV